MSDESTLSAYVDGELTANERAEIETQLASSPEWRAVLDELRTTRDAVRALPLVDAPDGFWERQLSPTGGQVLDLTAARGHRVHRPTRFTRWAASATSAAAVVVLGVTFVPQNEQVKPHLATLTDANAERSSLGNDVVINLAGAVVTQGVGR